MAGKPKTIELDVNGVRYEIDDDDPSGRDVRAAAGLNPASSFVLIHVRDRGSTSVGLDDKLDLKAGKVEIFRAFESDRIFTFTLDERAFEWGADPKLAPLAYERRTLLLELRVVGPVDLPRQKPCIG
ncbi:multiubiquitin domain-containing protein [Phenylobacterium sp.]|uniref:multiubiquitin domain-containing protein n=1 Tax=Phenylobacterium sp. TaxID=1871053 RepID=UPI0035B372A0